MTTKIEKPDLIERLCNVAADDRETIAGLFIEAAREVWPNADDVPQNFIDCVTLRHFDQAAPILVPENCFLSFCTHGLGGFDCAVAPAGGDGLKYITAKTPATALAAASVAASRAMKGGA